MMESSSSAATACWVTSSSDPGVTATRSGPPSAWTDRRYASGGRFHPTRTLFGVDCRRNSDLVAAVGQVLPDVVVNAVGIVKQRPSSRESIPSIELNALLPHRLAEICRAARARLVHVSTDCVFSGRKGNYRETDEPHPVDLYGRTSTWASFTIRTA